MKERRKKERKERKKKESDCFSLYLGERNKKKNVKKPFGFCSNKCFFFRFLAKSIPGLEYDVKPEAGKGLVFLQTGKQARKENQKKKTKNYSRKRI